MLGSIAARLRSIGRPRTWNDAGQRSATWGRFYLDAGPASPSHWEIRRHRLGWFAQAGTRYVSIGRHRAALLAAVTAAALFLAGCGGGNTPLVPQSRGICVTELGHIRVDDFRCTNGSMAYDWWYLAASQTAPRIGQRATQGSLNRPQGRVTLGGVPTAGGPLSKAATPKSKAPTTKAKSTKTKATTKPKSGSSRNKSGGSKSGGSRSGGGRR